jgi:prepilin-type N-terminal cleavage/methylation domain-containing protein
MSKKGFTLLEVLVVLLIFSLISTLLTQGVSLVFDLRYRFLEQLDKQYTGFLQGHWFREVCASFSPLQSADGTVFSGSKNQVKGFSLAPLQGEKGLPKYINFRLNQGTEDMVLSYNEEGKEPITIASWIAREGSFYYLDTEGNWLDQWPPVNMDTSAQLPEAVMLQIDNVLEPLTWCVAIPGRHQPRSTIQDLL